jgi:hypothetical protein
MVQQNIMQLSMDQIMVGTGSSHSRPSMHATQTSNYPGHYGPHTVSVLGVQPMH